MNAVTHSRAPEADARPTVAAFLSFLFPGLGQAYNGQRQLAWILALPIVVLTVAVAVALLAAGAGVLSQLLDTGFLVGVIFLDLVLLGWRLIAIAQAHGRRAPIRRGHWTGWATALLLIVTVAMHALPAYWAAKAIDTLGAVAREGSGVSRGGVAGLPGGGQLPEPSHQPEVRLGERVNILLVGIDSMPGRSERLTDTMMVVSIDPRGRSAMISIPRDLYGTPLPDGRVYNAKLNSLMLYASERPDEYPEGGVGTLKSAVSELLGIRIHYFVAMNLIGFKQAVDAIGGVDLDVKRPIDDPTYRDEYLVKTGFYLDAGYQHLDGHVALGYVRSRKGEGDNDFTRADRQQQLLTAVRQKLTAGNLVMALPGLLDAVKNTFSTDIPEARFSELATAIQASDLDKLERIVLQPPEYMTADPGSAAGYILIPNIEAIRAVVHELLRGRSAVGSGLAGSS